MENNVQDSNGYQGRNRCEEKTLIIDENTDLLEVKGELYGLRRQLRQRTALFSIFLSKMGGATFEFDIARDTAYFTTLGEKKELKEFIINGFRHWLRTNVEYGDRMIEMLNEFIRTDGASGDWESYGTIESPARFLSDELRWYRADYQIIRDDDGQLASMIGYVQDIHDEITQQEKLRNRALRDSMTKLYNRATTERMINEALAGLESGEKGVLFLLDVDDFKKINDQLGHLAGDSYLMGVSDAMRKAFREHDIIGRLGGDEFAVFVKGCITLDIVEQQGNRLIDLFLKVHCKENWKVTCSIGIAATSDTSMTYDKLLENADNAMYRAKRKGKNRYYIYGLD